MELIFKITWYKFIPYISKRYNITFLYKKRSFRHPRSNKHGRKWPYMEKYDDIHGPVLRSVYLRVVYGNVYNRLQAYTESVIVDLGY